MSKIRSAAALVIGGVLLKAARKRLPSAMDKLKEKMSGDGGPMERGQGMTASRGQELYATPELRVIFEEWMQKIEAYIIEVVEREPDVSEETIARELGISKESTLFLINKAVEEGKIRSYAGTAK